MAIVIKEIRVRTVVEKKIITETELSDETYRKIERQVMEKISQLPIPRQPERNRKKER